VRRRGPTSLCATRSVRAVVYFFSLADVKQQYQPVIFAIRIIASSLKRHSSEASPLRARGLCAVDPISA